MKKFIASFLACTLYFATMLNSGTANKIWVTDSGNKSPQLFDPIQTPNQIRTTVAGKTTIYNVVDQKDLECMSKNIYFEAAIESTAGKMAVAQVTMNRVNSPKFPNTVCAVITQGKHHANGFPVRDRCQFSWYCDGKGDDPHKGKMWRESELVAEYVLSTPTLMDITDGATHYHANYIDSPRWAVPSRKTVAIDTHIFFNHSRKRARKNLTSF
jgi:N-acetylmuramoyl-L-alanine amidase